jgi:hypothetical protein
MPLPVSLTDTHTLSSAQPLFRVIRPFWGIAWAALTSRFMKTWLICDGRHSTWGSVP